MSAKRRINITTDSETMRLADRLARRRRTSRSAVFRDGVRALADQERREKDSAARRKRQMQAIADMDRLARKFGDWPAEAVLREARDRRAAEG